MPLTPSREKECGPVKPDSEPFQGQPCDRGTSRESRPFTYCLENESANHALAAVASHWWLAR